MPPLRLATWTCGGRRAKTENPVGTPNKSLPRTVLGLYLRSMTSNVRLSVAIPTCGRPDKLAKAVASFNDSRVPLDIIVWDSLPNNTNRELADNTTNVELHESQTLTGPAESRYELGRRIRTELVMFADDDHFPQTNAVETLINLMDRYTDVDMLSVRWSRAGKDHALIQQFRFGYAGDGGRTVQKIFGFPNEVVDLGLELIQTDVPTPTFITRASVLRHIAFDPRFEFYFDLWDFGMQIHEAGLRSYATPLATFEHEPGGYGDTETKRSVDKSVDRERFVSKWGVVPIGGTGARKDWLT